MNVDLYVDELVLHGFSRADRHPIGQALEHELGLLFTDQGVPTTLARSGWIPRLDGGSFEAEPGSEVGAIGAQIARAVYGGFGA